MKRPVTVFLTVFGSLTLLGLTGLAAADKPTDGQALYREYCKPCHKAHSKAGEYTPMTLIQSQWNRFFDKKYEKTHRDVIDEQHGKRKVTDVISPEDLEKIRAFAVDHAADSENPMTCG